MCQDPMLKFTSDLIYIMDSTIPKTIGKPRKLPAKAWFNSECKKAISDRKKALKRFERYPDISNLIEYKRKKAIARRTIKRSKQKSWQEYISGISIKTSIKDAWNKLAKIQGKKIGKPISHLMTARGIATMPQDIADELGRGLFSKCSGENYSDNFRLIKSQAELSPVLFNIENQKSYNDPITFEELSTSIKRSRVSSPGPDGIPYTVWKKMPGPTIHTVLSIFNRIWREGTFPNHWREAYVVCLHKSGKDPTDPLSYRPISLTNTSCKLFEKIVCDRLIYHLESQQLLSYIQSGFRKMRSTTDHLISLESFVREGFLEKQSCIGEFFDLEAAYDRCWRHGALKDSQNMGIDGRLPTFAKNFLHNREFRVKLGNVLSCKYPQKKDIHRDLYCLYCCLLYR